MVGLGSCNGPPTFQSHRARNAMDVVSQVNPQIPGAKLWAAEHHRPISSHPLCLPALCLWLAALPLKRRDLFPAP